MINLVKKRSQIFFNICSSADVILLLIDQLSKASEFIFVSMVKKLLV